MNILLGVTGSVAATLTPKLCRSLVEEYGVGHVKVIPTEKSLYFFDYFTVEGILDPDMEFFVKPMLADKLLMYTDKEEWPSNRYRKNQDIPHITLGNWADIFVIAPLTLNTMSKMFYGLADNLLTCTYQAWDNKKPIIIAPAMNTRMWENQGERTSYALVRRNRIKYNTNNLHCVWPVSKKLACGDEGVGGLADINVILDKIKEVLPKEK